MVGNSKGSAMSPAGEETPLVSEGGSDIEQGLGFQDEPDEEVVSATNQLKPIKEGSIREMIVGVFGAITCKYFFIWSILYSVLYT